MHRIPVYSPWRAKNTSKYLQEVVETNWFTSGGKFYDAATEKLKELLQAKHVLLTNSGTSACDLMVNVFTQLEPRISFFEVPDSVYAAAWNSLLRIPDLYFQTIDLNLHSWNADLMTHENGAVLNVHNLGNPNKLFGVNTKFVLEDNCEGLFGTYDGVPTGKRCRASACSFFGNKTITCGEGGALVTDDTEFYELAKLIHGQGQGSKKFIHEKLGNNYRMTNTAAAILLSQIEALDDILAMKEYLFHSYRTNLSEINCKFQKTVDGCKSANWMFGLRFPKQTSYDEAEKFFAESNIETRPMFYPAEKQPYLQQEAAHRCIGEYHPNATTINQTAVILPSYPDIAVCDMKRVMETAKRYADYLEKK
jgi:perosamine synthetase